MSGPKGCAARVVMALILLTALITLAAIILVVMALLPVSQTSRLWFGAALFILFGVIVVYVLLQRIRGGDAMIRKQMDALFGPLALSLQKSSAQSGLYAGVYRGREMRAAYAISGTPQRPVYQLEIALSGRNLPRLAIGMATVQHQFDEEQFGALLTMPDAAYQHLLVYSDDTHAALALLTQPRVRMAVLDMLAVNAPGARNLVVTEGAVALRYRHLSLKALTPDQIRRWRDDLAAVVASIHAA